MLPVGAPVRIRPAYSHETGEHDVWDDIAGCDARVVEQCGADAMVRLVGGDTEVYVSWRRLVYTGGD